MHSVNVNKRYHRITGYIIDVANEIIYPGQIEFDNKIRRITRLPEHLVKKQYILPGLVDAHVHIESSMLIPSEYSRIAVQHGVVAAVADPHEIANVLGLKGIKFMLSNGNKTPFKFYWGAPSCVPATRFETSGAVIDHNLIEVLFRKYGLYHLSEVMNYPGVINHDMEVMAKIAIAKRLGKHIDGHAPGLTGRDLDKYISAGIETDHECYMLSEAREKQRKGMKIIVRQGSAAKNLNELYSLLNDPDTMLCTDDIHPDDLSNSYINGIIKQAIELGVPVIKAIKAATYNPVKHYGLNVGLLHEGDPADIVIIDSINRFNVMSTWINGVKVYDRGKIFITKSKTKPINIMRRSKVKLFDIVDRKVPFIIKAKDGQLVTDKINTPASCINIKKDVLKIVVVNRYKNTKPAVGYIRGFGIKHGAFGSTIMHDSHNIGVIGADDKSIVKVVNTLIRIKGGLAVLYNNHLSILRLPYAGLMTNDYHRASQQYKKLTNVVKRMGCKFKAPFMTLSFMGLLVIPHAKISDKGLFDCDKFDFA
ncbi:adenine deaminase [Candidatus Micrarchaeota archaeon]|nr:adenine deaminase [Candidatus Micrarchaeota archaeon]